MPYGTLNADTITNSNGLSGNAIGPGFKNRIINGAMVIDQRNAGASVSTTTVGSRAYSLDRWYYLVNPASKFTIQQNAGSVTPPVGFANYLGCTSTSAYSVGASDYLLVGQAIEGFNFADCGWGTANAKTITLSFQVRSSLTGTFGGSLRNSAINRYYPFSYTISSANTWTSISITISGDTTGTWVGSTNGIGLDILFSLGVGSTFLGTANVWTSSAFLGPTGATSVVGTNGATWYVTGVQLEVGPSATSFDYRPYGTELALCQRYYYRKKADVAFGLFGSASIATTALAAVVVPFPVPMRTTPTALEQSGTATDYRVYSTGATACNAVPTFSVATNSTNALVEFNTAATMTVGYAAFGSANNTTNAYLGWSAEL